MKFEYSYWAKLSFSSKRWIKVTKTSSTSIFNLHLLTLALRLKTSRWNIVYMFFRVTENKQTNKIHVLQIPANVGIPI